MAPTLFSESSTGDNGSFGLYHGDTHNLSTVLEQLPDDELDGGLIDTVITSPPYGDLKDYNIDKGVQVGQGQEYNEYLEDLRQIFADIYEYTKETGTMWLVANTFSKDGHLHQLPFDIADVCRQIQREQFCPECDKRGITVPLWTPASFEGTHCQNCGYEPETEPGWILQDVIIWDKQRALPYTSGDRVRNVFEYILMFSKTEDYSFNLDQIREADPTQFKRWWINYPDRYHPRGKVPDNIWNFTTPTQGSWGGGTVDHPAPFPQKLISRILRLTTEEGDVVFDPFAGSGSVLAQADAMDRRPLGIEYNKDYCDAYETLKADFNQSRDQERDNETVLAQQQRDLEQLIAGLRQTRFGREMIRTTAKQYGLSQASGLPVAYLVHVCDGIENSSKTSSDFITAQYYIVIDQDRYCDEVESKVETALETDLCSGYEIDHTVNVVPISEFQEAVEHGEYEWIDRQLFVYEEGHHNEYIGTLSPPSLVDETYGDSGFNEETIETEKYPPIFSTQGLQVPQPEPDTDPLEFEPDFLTVEFGRADEPVECVSIPTE